MAKYLSLKGAEMTEPKSALGNIWKAKYGEYVTTRYDKPDSARSGMVFGTKRLKLRRATDLSAYDQYICQWSNGFLVMLIGYVAVGFAH